MSKNRYYYEFMSSYIIVNLIRAAPYVYMHGPTRYFINPAKIHSCTFYGPRKEPKYATFVINSHATSILRFYARKKLSTQLLL